MKLMVLIHEYPPVGGGGGQVAEDICTHLQKKGHSIRLITSHYGNLPKYEKKSGVEIIRVHCGRKNSYSATFFNMLWFIIFGFFRALNEIRKERPDVVHVHFAVPAGVLGWLIKKIKHIPYMMTVHLGDVPGGVPEKTDQWFRWLKPFIPTIWHLADKVIAVSHFTRNLSLKTYDVPIDVIPNGVKLIRSVNLKTNRTKPVEIIFAGRFVDQKNPLMVINVLSELKELKWHCRMLGDGALKSEMQELIEKKGLKDRISFSGWISPEHVQKYLAQSDLLFMPSRSEGLPVIGVQALAVGLAIVAGNYGGFTDLVNQGKNGYLYDPDDKEAMVKAIRNYCTDRVHLLVSRKLSLQKAKKFNIDIVVDRYESQLQKIIEA
jgi:glycosyltransferase involved in cell wall biosynthesis